MFAGCLQIMWAHSHLIRVVGGGYSQIIRAENADVCRSYGLCLQAATPIWLFCRDGKNGVLMLASLEENTMDAVA